MKLFVKISLVFVLCIGWFAIGWAQDKADDEGADLAKKLANPVAALISVPLQYNYDENIGPNGDGSKSLLNVQPVIPLSLGNDWNLIVRTIVPLIVQEDIPVKGEDKSGMGDIVQSFFFSPKELVGGWVFAVGPVGLYPSATDEMLGGERWGAEAGGSMDFRVFDQSYLVVCRR